MPPSEPVRPSHHICFLYDDVHHDLLSQTINFCVEGLACNNKVVCTLVDDAGLDRCEALGVSLPLNYNFMKIEEVIKGLEREGIDVQAYINGGQLLFQTSHSSYLQDGVFDPSKALASYQFFVNSARKDGFQGTRILADMSFALSYLGFSKVDKLFEFESKLNLLQAEFPEFIGMCCFDTTLFSSVLQKECMQTHPVVMCQHVVHKNNFYYISPEKYLTNNHASAWLNNLTERNQTELRLETKCSQLLQETYDLNRTKESNSVVNTKDLFAQELNRQKQSFLSNISHEIRTPLTGVLGGIELLKSTEISNEQKECLNFLVPSVQYLSHVMSSILELDQDVVLREIPTNINYVITRAMEEAKGITVGQITALEISHTISDDMPELVMVDEQKLKQILINIISNSIKFSKSNCHILVSVQVVEKDEYSIQLRFKIEDNGIGIIAGDNTNIFDTFWQSDRSASKPYAGMGLGLAATKSLVTAMGGNIRVDSAGLGLGTTVEFTIHAGTIESYVHSPPLSLANSQLLDKQSSTSQSNMANLQSLSSSSSLPSPLSNLSALDSEVDLSSLSPPSLSSSAPDAYVNSSTESSSPSSSSSSSANSRQGTPELPSSTTRRLRKQKINKFISLSAETVNDQILRPTEQIAKKISILLAEDNLINSKIIVQLLAKLGHNPDVARNGMEAVTATREKEYDIIFMDLHMPVMDGFQATEEILNIASVGQPKTVALTATTTGQPKIVALTASVSELDKTKCERAGMVGHLSKPVSSLALQKMISSVVVY